MITAKYARASANQLVYTGPCKVTGFYAKGAAAAGRVILFDGTDALGKSIRDADVEASADREYEFSKPLEFKTGIYVQVATPCAFWVVEYIE